MTVPDKTHCIGPVLMTGGNGFIGKALTDALIAKGETVVVIDTATDHSGNPAVHRLNGDIRDVAMLRNVARHHDVRAIVHLAALVIPACRENPALGAEINVIGHINLLEIAQQFDIKRFLYTSSVAARSRDPFDSPANLYGAYKQCCEQVAKIWYLDHSVPSVGLRPNVIYGPGREDGETAAISLAVKAAAEDRPFTMPFSGAMGFQYIDEVVDIMMRCLYADVDEPVVSDISTRVETIDDVINAIRQCAPNANITPSNRKRPAPPSLDNAPLRALIGEWRSVGLFEGVAKTFAYYQASC